MSSCDRAELDRRLAAEQAERARRDAELQARRRLRISGLPLRHVAKARPVLDLSDVAWRGALDRLITSPSPFIYAITGPRGIGKTQLAACLAVEVVNRGPVRYAALSDMASAIREASFGTGKRNSEAASLRPFIEAELLIVDEINEGNSSDFTSRCLTRIVDGRYSAMRSTVLLSNHAPADFLAAVGASIGDRIREDGGIIDGSAWPPMRGTAAVVQPDPAVLAWMDMTTAQ